MQIGTSVFDWPASHVVSVGTVVGAWALNDENAKIAKWLTELTDDESDRSFGQWFSFGWNHKRVYRIYRDVICTEPADQTE